MNGLMNKKLREVGTLERGRSRYRPRYAFHLFNGSYPFIQTGEVRASKKYITKYENTYNDEGLKQSKLWPKGTLCITIAANIAELAILDFDACFPDSILGFIPDTNSTSVDYVYYTLMHYQKQLKHIGEGSVQDNINLGTFENIDFPFPVLSEQKAIASVLSSLDDKIDLLHRQNKTLEAMAETLFRQWLDENNTKNWIDKELISFGKIICGKTPSKSNPLFFGDDVPFLKIPDMHNRVFVFNTDDKLSFAGANNQPKKMISSGSICVSCIATVGLVCISDREMQTNQQINSIVPNRPYYTYFLYLLMKSMYEELNNLASGGTATLNLNTGDFSKLKISAPSDNDMKLFHQSVVSFFDKIKINSKQIYSLEKLRDTVLPKLMSGEVRVEYAKKKR